MRALDLAGQRFGRLVAMEVGHDSVGRRGWFCQCDCGGTKFYTTSQLTAGNAKSCGCLGRLSLFGQKLGRLTVVEELPRKKPGARRYYRCICECGNEAVVEGSKLKNGHTRSCGCLHKEADCGSANRKGWGESLRNKIYASYRSNARHKELEFDLSKEEAFALFAQSCHYCGRAPYKTITAKRSYGSFTYTGIDRLDSSKGYVGGNVVPCCWECNSRKSSTDYEDFVAWIRMVYENLRAQGDSK